MPHVGRTAQRSQARYMRESGEQVTLLVGPQGGTSTSTPFSLTTANESVDIATAQRVLIYAKVKFIELGDVKYQEGGKAVFRKCLIETTSEWVTPLQQCFAVMLDDGSVLRKECENLSETQAIYCITCSGYVGISQTL
jgi:hypothetical protein